MTSRWLPWAILALPFAASAQHPDLLPGFRPASQFAEQERWTRLESGVRVYLNAPLPLVAENRALVLYATPNGNTIEQTLGCTATEGRDWHFDIQHVAAQIRQLREISPDRDIVLAVVEAPKLSWPAFRQEVENAGQIIKSVVENAAQATAAKRMVLSGHSGGGSFLFGYIEANEALPAAAERIVFLDANYAYSDEKNHGDKLLAWLRGDAGRKLVVIAYDDREITLNGKKVVSPTGGTFRASQRMVDRFSREAPLTEDRAGDFIHRRGLDGQIEFFIHPNAENKILHTALVGEMNGLLHGVTLGTDRERTWGKFDRPRAYTKWIQTEPIADLATETIKLPPRPADAPTGSAFLRQIEFLSREEREASIRKEITHGNVPEFLRWLQAIDVEATDHNGVKHIATIHVTSDYLAVGTDDDFFRIPMSPLTAQAIADACEASLITCKLSDKIFQRASVKLAPKPLTNARDAAATFYQHHQIIEEQRQGHPLGLLVAGIKKDVVLTNRLKEKPQRVAIYGWHYPEGKPIQPLYVGHVDWYVDYSHGIRLMSRQMIVDGRPMDVNDVLKDDALSVLISNEGPITSGYK